MARVEECKYIPDNTEPFCRGKLKLGLTKNGELCCFKRKQQNRTITKILKNLNEINPQDALIKANKLINFHGNLDTKNKKFTLRTQEPIIVKEIPVEGEGREQDLMYLVPKKSKKSGCRKSGLPPCGPKGLTLGLAKDGSWCCYKNPLTIKQLKERFDYLEDEDKRKVARTLGVEKKLEPILDLIAKVENEKKDVVIITKKELERAQQMDKNILVISNKKNQKNIFINPREIKKKSTLAILPGTKRKQTTIIKPTKSKQKRIDYATDQNEVKKILNLEIEKAAIGNVNQNRNQLLMKQQRLYESLYAIDENEDGISHNERNRRRKTKISVMQQIRHLDGILNPDEAPGIATEDILAVGGKKIDIIPKKAVKPLPKPYLPPPKPIKRKKIIDSSDLPIIRDRRDLVQRVVQQPPKAARKLVTLVPTELTEAPLPPTLNKEEPWSPIQRKVIPPQKRVIPPPPPQKKIIRLTKNELRKIQEENERIAEEKRKKEAGYRDTRKKLEYAKKIFSKQKKRREKLKTIKTKRMESIKMPIINEQIKKNQDIIENQKEVIIQVQEKAPKFVHKAFADLSSPTEQIRISENDDPVEIIEKQKDIINEQNTVIEAIEEKIEEKIEENQNVIEKQKEAIIKIQEKIPEIVDKEVINILEDSEKKIQIEQEADPIKIIQDQNQIIQDQNQVIEAIEEKIEDGLEQEIQEKIEENKKIVEKLFEEDEEKAETELGEGIRTMDAERRKQQLLDAEENRIRNEMKNKTPMKVIAGLIGGKSEDLQRKPKELKEKPKALSMLDRWDIDDKLHDRIGITYPEEKEKIGIGFKDKQKMDTGVKDYIELRSKADQYELQTAPNTKEIEAMQIEENKRIQLEEENKRIYELEKKQYQQRLEKQRQEQIDEKRQEQIEDEERQEQIEDEERQKQIEDEERQKQIELTEKQIIIETDKLQKDVGVVQETLQDLKQDIADKIRKEEEKETKEEEEKAVIEAETKKDEILKDQREEKMSVIPLFEEPQDQDVYNEMEEELSDDEVSSDEEKEEEIKRKVEFSEEEEKMGIEDIKLELSEVIAREKELEPTNVRKQKIQNVINRMEKEIVPPKEIKEAVGDIEFLDDKEYLSKVLVNILKSMLYE